MSDSLRPRRVRASYSMDFKLELVEKSYQPGACVAQLAREHGINDNLLFTWRQRYSHLLPDEIQRSVSKPDAVIPVVVSDMSLSHHAEPHYEPSGSAYGEVMTCEVDEGFIVGGPVGDFELLLCHGTVCVVGKMRDL
ncbi:hypothetical protein DD590_25670, partial [Klebsiella pneumoniae]